MKKKKKLVTKKKLEAKKAEVPLLKLDFGCGKNPKEGFKGVDILDFGQDFKLNIGKEPWPWKDSSVDEAHAAHFIEHLEPKERIHFVNELHRVLKPGAKCTIITPHFASVRAYGDLTHKWPPVVDFWFYYLSKNWREQNAPHNTEYTCDLVATWGYSLHPTLHPKNQEYQQHAITFWKEAAQDTIATLSKPEDPNAKKA